jgi:hypothetical protein
MRRAMNRGKACAALVAIAFASFAVGDEPKSRLETLMGAQFHEAGLDRQSAAELAVLERWMIEHASELRLETPISETPSATEVVEAEPARERRAKREEKKSDDRVLSRIVGTFKGWRPGTTLTLANGQKWRVSDDSALTISRGLENPAVMVERGSFGSWWLQVEGYNTVARVKPAN